MSSDAADRGVKPPRTLFSLGRPGAKQGAGSDESAPASDDAAEEEGELLFACGACGEILPGGAVFCGECGTPIDTSVYDDYPNEDETLPAVVGAETVVIDGPAANTSASDTVVLPPNDELPPLASDEGDRSSEGAGAVTTQLPAPDHNATVSVSAVAMAAAMESAGDVSSDTGTGTGTDTQEMPALSVPEDPASGDSAPDLSEPSEAGSPAAPAATLYADPTTAEPLGRESSGQWVSDPSMGHVSTDDGRDESAAAAGASATVAAAPATTASSAAPPVSSGLSGTTAAAMPYGTGPVESSQKSKVPMIAGIAAGGVVLLVIMAVVFSGGNKDSGTVASVDSTTTLRPVNTSSTAAPASTTTAKATTTSTAATTTSTGDTTSSSTAPDTTASTTAPTLPPVTPPLTAAPPTTARPIAPTTQGSPNLSFNSTTLTISQGGSGTLNLNNSGNGPGGFLCSPKDSITVSPASGTVPAGNSIQITFTDQNKPGRFARINCSLPNGNVEIVVGVS